MRVLVCAALLLPVAAPADELRLEVGAGIAQHAKRKDGLWYQSEYPNEHHLTAGAFQVGGSWLTSTQPWRYGARLALRGQRQ